MYVVIKNVVMHWSTMQARKKKNEGFVVCGMNGSGLLVVRRVDDVEAE